MHTDHYSYCTIYSSLINKNPEDGICTCGYGLQERILNGNFSEMYSEELLNKVHKEKKVPHHLVSLIKKILEDNNQK